MAWKQAILARNGGGNYLINKITKSYYIIARSLRVILSSLKNGTVELTTIFRYNNG